MTFVSCTKEDLSPRQEVASKAIGENLVLSRAATDSIFDANVKHDSLWYIELTLDEALAEGVSEEQYCAFVKEMNAANEMLREAYRLGQKVRFAESNHQSSATKSFEPEFYATATIDGNSYNNSTFVSFTCKASTVIMIVSSSFNFWSLNINGDQIFGSNGQRVPLSHREGADSSGNYQWSLNIKSMFTIVPPEMMTFVFANVGA